MEQFFVSWTERKRSRSVRKKRISWYISLKKHTERPRRWSTGHHSDKKPQLCGAALLWPQHEQLTLCRECGEGRALCRTTGQQVSAQECCTERHVTNRYLMFAETGMPSIPLEVRLVYEFKYIGLSEWRPSHLRFVTVCVYNTVPIWII